MSQAQDLILPLVGAYIFVLVISLVYSEFQYKKTRISLYRDSSLLWLFTMVALILEGVWQETTVTIVFSFISSFPAMLVKIAILKKVSKKEFPFALYCVVFAVCMFGIVALNTTGNFTLTALPAAVAIAFPCLHAAYIILSSQRNIGAIKAPFITSYALVIGLCGIHYLDFPFFRMVPGLAILGFSIALALVTVLGFAVPFFISANAFQIRDAEFESFTQNLEIEMRNSQQETIFAADRLTAALGTKNLRIIESASNSLLQAVNGSIKKTDAYQAYLHTFRENYGRSVAQNEKEGEGGLRIIRSS